MITAPTTKMIDTIDELERVYGDFGAVGEASTAKVADHVTPHYRRYLEAAPFCALATIGPEGLDCSPRGDKPGFLRIHDDRTLMLPDRRGNNRIDSLRNVVRDPRVALMALIPGVGNAMRINGRAHLTADSALLESFAIDGKSPRTVMIITVQEIYFQCARAPDPLRPLDRLRPYRSQDPADPRRDPCRDEPRPGRRPRLRCQLGRPRRKNHVVARLFHSLRTGPE